jgi:membrane protease YdiL (CAAX protease family)
MRVGVAGYTHLALFGIFLPYLAIKSGGRLATRPLPPKVAHFTSQIVMLTLFLAASVFFGRREWIDLFPRMWPEPRMFVLGAAVLVMLVVLMRPLWRSRVEARARRLWLFMPRTRKERVLWVACSCIAGISEEVTYRGVMFVLLWRLTGSALAAALIGAGVFAVSHFLQGATSMAIIFGFALVFQGIAWLSGSLYVGMAVHALYDVAAGLSYGFFGERLGYPTEPMPP